MRLKQRDIDAIKWAATEVFGAEAVVHLYGSRVRDDLRGGDIDLLIDVPSAQDGWRAADKFRARLFERIDEQRVDVVFRVRGTTRSAFVRLVERDAVPLP